MPCLLTQWERVSWRRRLTKLTPPLPPPSHPPHAVRAVPQVRGKDFRHEKTKKKRGSYRGGLIESDMVASHKFESDDE